MQTLLGSIWGLRGVDEIRVVGAYSSRPMTEQKFAADQINLWVRSRWVEGHPLSAFSAPEDRFVYKQFLLRYREKNRESGRRERKPLALAVGLAPHIVEWCFERIHAVTKGIPSNLKSDAVEATISVMLNLPDGQFPPILRDANDDDDLAALPRNRDIAP